MRNLIALVAMTLLCSCTTITYPNGTRVTTPYDPSVYSTVAVPVYGGPGYPVPVAPYSPPGTPGGYYGYGGGYAPVIGLGLGNWGKWWGWGGGSGGSCYGGNNNNWNGWNAGCHNYNSWHPCSSYRDYSGIGGYHYGH